MRLRLQVRSFVPLAVLLAAACVSETRGPSGEIIAESEPDTGKFPLEQAEDRVRELLDTLQRSGGKDLLALLDRIASYREIALRPIRERLATGDARTRSHLIYVLGRMGGPDARGLLLDRLSDPDAVVRFESAAALLDDAELAGVPVLVKSLRDPDRKLRFKAFESLKRFTKQDFGYDFAADEPVRERAAAQWDAWWSKTRAELIYVGATVERKSL